jgi:branched-chain amino acid transport system substrate-binding protein
MEGTDLAMNEQDTDKVLRRRTVSHSLRTYRVAILAVMVSAVLLVTYVSGLFSSNETVTIGVIAPLTGSSSHLADVVDGMDMAVDKLNRWGGLNGARIELIVRDSGSDPNMSVALFEDIESASHPLIYVSAACSCTRPLIPLAEEYRVPLMGIATANAIGFEESNWSFRYYPGTSKETGPALAVLDSLGVSSLGIMRSDNVIGIEIAESLKSAFEAAGGTVEFADYCCKDGDIPAKAAELADNEAIYIAADYKATIAGLQAVREIGYPGVVLGSSAASAPNITSMPEAEGMYVSAPAVYNPNYIPAQSLVREFEERYGHSMTHFAVSGYDAVNLIYGLMLDKDLTRDVMREQLHGGFSYPSVLGPVVVSPGSHDIQYDLLRARVVEGQLWYL